MTLRVKFFGKFHIVYGETPLTSVTSQKSLELLAYLILKREAQSRDAIANLIWADQASTDQSRKYLRNTLWQLQKEFAGQFPEASSFLSVGGRSISVDPSFPLWSDVEEFETAYENVRGQDGQELTDDQVETVRRAVDLYVGPFLEGWFSEWCLVHRERCQHLALLMLDKLMDHAAIRGEFESGILYGERILAYDRAREVTHRKLMRLFYLSGDRTSALRQFQLCESILKEELEITPSERTRHVLESIRNDTLDLDRNGGG